MRLPSHAHSTCVNKHLKINSHSCSPQNTHTHHAEFGCSLRKHVLHPCVLTCRLGQQTISTSTRCSGTRARGRATLIVCACVPGSTSTTSFSRLVGVLLHFKTLEGTQKQLQKVGLRRMLYTCTSSASSSRCERSTFCACPWRQKKTKNNQLSCAEG